MEFQYKKFIVIDGTDGCGKSTQAKALVNHFPNYDDYPGMAIRTMLNGKYGETADDVNMYAASIMYTVDRYTALHGDYKKYFTDPEMTIISDRYVSSNLIHQGAKIIKNNSLAKDKLNDYVAWLYDLEFNFCELPKPDKMIYLSIPPEEAIKRMDSSGKERDIHEQLDFMKRTYYAGNYYAQYFGWKIIDANREAIEVLKDIVNYAEDDLV